jgi:Pyruvate/2-oxoacid:ferredoxin oxidoreductase delta subunit
MDAITLNSANTAAVDEARCLGCGLCAAHCVEKAVTLIPRQPANHPPDVATFLERKLG